MSPSVGASRFLCIELYVIASEVSITILKYDKDGIIKHMIINIM